MVAALREPEIGSLLLTGIGQRGDPDLFDGSLDVRENCWMALRLAVNDRTVRAFALARFRFKLSIGIRFFLQKAALK
jgi:hypothetical protein